MSLLPRTLLALALIGCTPTDGGITKFNNAPVAAITSHTDGDEVLEGTAVTFRGTISDTNDAAEDLVATWYSGADEICATAPVGSDGTTTCEALVGLDLEEIVLEGQDDDNASGTARVTLVVKTTEAPTATITAPVGEGPWYADVPVLVEAVVADGEDAPEDLVVAWTDASGAPVVIDDTADASGALSGSVLLPEGEHTLTLTVTDTTGKAGTASVDVAVGPANNAPTCAISAPIDGASVALDTTVTFAGTVADPDTAGSALSATWSSDLDGALFTGAPGGDGSTGFDTDALAYGTHVITLSGTDEVGAACEASIVLSVGAAPDVVIDAPVDGAVVNEGELVAFLATVSDDGATPDALALAWESDRDGLLDATPADGSGLAAFDTDALSVGEHVVTLAATDLDGLWAEASISLRVNDLPSAPGVTLAPASPSTDDDLVATLVTEASDAEGDAITYTYAWTVDGAPTAHVGDTVPAVATASGEVWTVIVTPNDGWGDGEAATASVTVGNSAPSLADVTLTPGTAREGDTLTCTPGVTTDADGDTVSYTYAWTVDGVTVAATGSTFGDTWWGRGDAVVCLVTPHDGTSAGATVASGSVTIDNSAPSIASVSVSPASPTASDTLTCTAVGFADADGDAGSADIAWMVDGVEVGTGSTLAAGAFVGGDEVVCTGTPTDGTDRGEPVSASVVIGNSPPITSTPTLSPSSPTEADTLTCTPGITTDADGTTSFTYDYSWTIGGAVVAATGPTLDGDDFDKGDVVRCRVTPSDGTEEGAMVASLPVTVANTAPAVSSVTLSPASPDTDDTITATASGSDIDGDTVSYTYAWYVDGAAAGTGATLAGTAFSRGQDVHVVVTPSDGAASGPAMSSAAVTIANSAPTITAATITPETAYATSTLTCAASGYADADGDASATSFAWTVDGAAAGTGPTLSGAFAAGDVVVCTATAHDGTVAGTSRADSVTIAGSAPVLASVSLSPTTAYEASTLTCAPGTTTDADGTTSFSYTYAWTVNGSAIAPTTSTLTGAYFSKGNTVTCRATPSDGTLTGAAVTSNTVTIANTAPVASAVTLSPTTAYEGTTLTCSPSGTDADGDTVSWTYAWYVNGSAVAATGSTLTGAYFGKGNAVYCRATPTDGATAGSAVSSSAATISNSAPSAPTVAIDPEDPEAGLDALWCEVVTPGTDVDGDTLSYTYAWTRNGSSFTGTTSTTRPGDTVPASATAADDTWVCSASAYDGAASSSAGTDTVDVLAGSYTIGYATPFASPATGYSASNYNLGQKITVSSAVELYQLGVLLRLADTDSLRMALYTNAGGLPGTLVAYTELTSLAPYGAGAVEMDVVGAPVSLPAGTYWITMNTTDRVYFGYTTEGAASNVIAFTSLSSTSPFPSSFGTASTYTNQILNQYMVVR